MCEVGKVDVALEEADEKEKAKPAEYPDENEGGQGEAVDDMFTIIANVSTPNLCPGKVPRIGKASAEIVRAGGADVASSTRGGS